MKTERVISAGPCRWCGDPSWLADPFGPVHPCCERWQEIILTGRKCPACVEARVIRRQRAWVTERQVVADAEALVEVSRVMIKTGPPCAHCGRPLLLMRAGRDVCAACDPQQVYTRKDDR